MTEAMSDAGQQPAFSFGRLIATCAVGGVAVGLILSAIGLIEIADGWAHGYEGMLGRGFSIAVTLIFFIGGGAGFGVVAGMLAAGGVFVGQAVSRRWVFWAIGAALGAATVGPFAYVALCARRPARMAPVT